MTGAISLKALVDKERSKVIFLECGSNFVDVLFSFLTIPLARIIALAQDYAGSVEMGCMNNLYESVKNNDVEDFRSYRCRDYLLCPENVAKSHCNYLIIKLLGEYAPGYYVCPKGKFLRYSDYINCPCGCSRDCSSRMRLVVDISSQSGVVFVEKRAKFIVTDNLEVMPSSAATLSLFGKLGVTDINTTEELTWNIGIREVVKLLSSSLVSKTPFSDTLLKRKPIPADYPSNVNLDEEIPIGSQVFGDTINEDEESISVKLVVSKSKKMVCYAEVGADFVNLIFSFLALQLGFIVPKVKMSECSLKGCIGDLYKTVQDLDGQYMKSYHKEMLLDPKLLPGLSYKNSLIGIEEASFYYVESQSKLTTDSSLESVKLEVIDPISDSDGGKSGPGFLKRPAVFIVTDNLVVKPKSPIFELSVLKDLKVPFTDIEVRVVHVGKKEASRLLVAAFAGDSALTNAFIKEPREPKQEQ